MRKYNVGDLVNVKWCYELDMPCRVEGLPDWMREIRDSDKTIYLYNVTGKHNKRGNMVTVRVSEGQLESWQG